MSARTVRRPLEEQETEQSSRVEGSTDDEAEESPTGKPAQNFFSLLGSEDIEDEVANDFEGEDKDEVKIRNEPLIPERGAPIAKVSKSKKKSKGKKKGKSSTSATVESTRAAEEESVDELLERLSLQNERSVSTSDLGTAAGHADLCPEILGVDSRYLRAEDELRRIFGSKVINAAERGGDRAGMVGSRKRLGGSSHRGGRLSLKKTMLVMPHDDWPRPEGGVSMECVETREGIKFFRYTFSSSYQELQKRYEECSASHDPNTIVTIVNHHPYHIDSLLTLAEMYRHMGESQISADLLERCLYALECAWHPSFNITTGRCRLDFEWDPNKPLFVALFKHMQHLHRRGCHRAAFEVCKVLLSLDSDDPMGALFCIDYFAIRAEQYHWLTAFVRKYGTDRPLSLLPSFSLSLALTQFHIEDQVSASNSASKSGGKASLPKSPEVSLGQQESSMKLLQQALMLHPAFLNKIVDKAPIKEDAAWAKILKHHHFSRVTSENPTLEHLTNIYVARNYLVWRAPDVQTWLKEGAQAVIGIADEAITGNGGTEIAKWACVLKETFPGDENEYKHLRVSDFSDSAATLPPEEIQQFFPGHGAAPALPAAVMFDPAFQGIMDTLQLMQEEMHESMQEEMYE